MLKALVLLKPFGDDLKAQIDGKGVASEVFLVAERISARIALYMLRIEERFPAGGVQLIRPNKTGTDITFSVGKNVLLECQIGEVELRSVVIVCCARS